MHEEQITSGGAPSKSSSTALLAGAALLGGAALLATPKAARAVTPALTFADIPGTGDIKVLNFALALEAIEADLYVQALQRLGRGGRNALGQTITGLNVSSTDPFLTYLQVFGRVERQHRDFLINALGANAITNTALRGANFDFGINSFTEQTLLDLIIAVEDTGVQAYIGAIPSFSVGSPFLTTAASILGTEARHTAALTVVRNRKYGVQADTRNRKSSTAPQFNENGGRDGIIREGAQAGETIVSSGSDPTFLNTVLRGVSPFIILPS